MTDHMTEQSAAQFWREIDERVDKKIASLLKQQTGIIPDTAYGSVKFDSFGRATWGGVGGGGLRLLSLHYKNAQQTIPSSTDTIINYDQEVYDPDGIVTTGSSWHLTIPTSGFYLFVATIRFDEVASGWSAGDRATLRLWQNGGVLENFHTLDDPQNGTLNNILRCHVPYGLFAADEVALGIYQTSASGKDVSGDYLSTLSIWQC